jgi:hypothetical protein
MLFKFAILSAVAATASAGIVKRQAGNRTLCDDGVQRLLANDQYGADILVR